MFTHCFGSYLVLFQTACDKMDSSSVRFPNTEKENVLAEIELTTSEDRTLLRAATWKIDLLVIPLVGIYCKDLPTWLFECSTNNLTYTVRSAIILDKIYLSFWKRSSSVSYEGLLAMNRTDRTRSLWSRCGLLWHFLLETSATHALLD